MVQQLALDIVGTYGVGFSWIVALIFFGRVVLHRIVKRLVLLSDDGDSSYESNLEKRAETLGNITIATGKAVIYLTALLMFLDLFGVDIRPILAGAGIIGLAVGFGAQSLVKDFVSGLFILIENQYSVGDKVKLGSAEGVVKKITMRSTVLETDGGKTIYLSNGAIAGKEVINFSQSK
ncbi:MAG: hypothetical protein BMS9Abin13_223 [Patescibacteria group bacterium]|nr:MAG: hypothetical protein BMS9Abin13_223 [Patescibacteria group bacterium]